MLTTMACPRELETRLVRMDILASEPSNLDEACAWSNWKTELLRDFDDNVASFDRFRSQISDSIASHESRLCFTFGLASTSTTLPNIETVDGLELELLRAGFDGLRRELKELQWFDRVNSTAVVKLFAKLRNYMNDNALTRRQPHWEILQQRFVKSCGELFERVEKFSAEICLELSRPRLATHSWYLSRLVSHASATDVHYKLYGFIKNDKHCLVEEQILSAAAREAITKDMVDSLVATIFLVSIILSVKNTTALALAFMLRDKVSVEQIFEFVHIQGMSSHRSLREPQKSETIRYGDGVKQFAMLLDALGTEATRSLGEKDEHGYQLLHYAIHYGLTEFCELLISRLLRCDKRVAAATMFSADYSRRTPLHYAVDTGNSPLLSFMLKTLSEINLETQEKDMIRKALGDVLVCSIRTKSDDMATMLLEHDPDLLHRSSRGETALYCAAQLGNLPLTRLIISHLSEDSLGVDIVEQSRGWTPLIVACAHGHARIAELLVQAGSEISTRDSQNWTALEHAVFRGHHEITGLFLSKESDIGHDGPAKAVRAARTRVHSQYGASEKMLILHIGSTQGGHDRVAIQLGQWNSSFSGKLFQENVLELHVSIPGTDFPAKIVQLPMLEDQLHKPLIFGVKDGLPLQVVLDVYRYESLNSRMLIWRGMAELDQEQLLGEKHESLLRERTIYMMNQEGFSTAGTVRLSYVVAKPFAGLDKSVVPDYTPKDGSVLLVGHRGILISHDGFIGPVLTNEQKDWAKMYQADHFFNSEKIQSWYVKLTLHINLRALRY